MVNNSIDSYIVNKLKGGEEGMSGSVVLGRHIYPVTKHFGSDGTDELIT